jgi:hypothetical protein
MNDETSLIIHHDSSSASLDVADPCVRCPLLPSDAINIENDHLNKIYEYSNGDNNDSSNHGSASSDSSMLERANDKNALHRRNHHHHHHHHRRPAFTDKHRTEWDDAMADLQEKLAPSTYPNNEKASRTILSALKVRFRSKK